MDLQRLSLGERMVTVARLLAAEHVRQELHDRPADLAELHALSEQYRAIRGNGFAAHDGLMLRKDEASLDRDGVMPVPGEALIRQDQFMAGDTLAGRGGDSVVFSEESISVVVSIGKEAA